MTELEAELTGAGIGLSAASILWWLWAVWSIRRERKKP